MAFSLPTKPRATDGLLTRTWSLGLLTPPETGFCCPRLGFLNLSTVDILRPITHCLGGCPVSTHLEPAAATLPVVIIKIVSRRRPGGLDKGRGVRERWATKSCDVGTSLVVQWLRPSSSQILGWIPDQGTRSHMLQLRVQTLQLKIPSAVNNKPNKQTNK